MGECLNELSNGEIGDRTDAAKYPNNEKTDCINTFKRDYQLWVMIISGNCRYIPI